MELLGAVLMLYWMKSLLRVSAEPFRHLPWVTGVCATALFLVILAFTAK